MKKAIDSVKWDIQYTSFKASEFVKKQQEIKNLLGVLYKFL